MNDIVKHIWLVASLAIALGCGREGSSIVDENDTDTEDDAETDNGDDDCEGGAYWSVMSSPVSSDLDGVWGASGNDVWAVGFNGVILHYDGLEWSVVEHGLAATLDHVQGTSATDVWAAGWDRDGARVYHFDGTAWSQIDPGFSGRVRGLWVAGPSSVWVMGIVVPNAGGFVWHFDGTHWSQIDTGLDQVNGAWGPTEDLVYFVGDGEIGPYDAPKSQVERFQNGTTEAVYSLEWAEFEGIFGIDANNLYVVGDIWGENEMEHVGLILEGDGTFFTSSELGVELESSIKDIWGNSQHNLIAVGPKGLVLHRRDGAWHSMDSGSSASLNSVWGVSDTEAFAVGDRGAILHYGCKSEEPDPDPDTYDWKPLVHVNRTEFYGIWGASSDDLYISSTTGVWRVTDEKYASLIWPETEFGRQNGIWGASISEVFSVGSYAENGMARVVHCNGDDCAKMDIDIAGDLQDVHGFSETDVFAVGGIYEQGRPQAVAAHYDGQSWQQMNVDSDTWLTGVWGAAPDDIFASGWTFEGDGEVEYGRLLHYDGISWTVVEDQCDTKLISISGSSANTIYAVGQHEGAPSLDITPFGLTMGFDGDEWSDILVMDDRGFDAVWVSSEDEVYLGSRLWNEVEARLETEVLRLVDDEWEVLTVGPFQTGCIFEGIWGEPGGPVFGVTREATLMKYEDGQRSSESGEQ